MRYLEASFNFIVLAVSISDSSSTAEYPRAVIYDFVCTLREDYSKDQDDDLHTSVMEFPSYTYVGERVPLVYVQSICKLCFA